MEKQVVAKFDDDTKRTHRFLIQGNSDGITGAIYISKDQQVPDSIIVQLRTLADEKEGLEGPTL